jgi:hypothetical protein
MTGSVSLTVTLVFRLILTGSVLDKKKIRKHHVLTEDKFDDIDAQLEASLKKSLHHLALETGVSKTSAHMAAKLL